MNLKLLFKLLLLITVATSVPSLALSQSPYPKFEEDSETLWDEELDYEEFDMDALDFETYPELDGDELDSFEEDALDEKEFGIDQDETKGNLSDEDQYIDEGLIPTNTEGLLEFEILRRRALLAEERINAPFNVAYGVGTGLMIGGWFALLFANTSRDTLRSLGLGIVLGGIMGVVIGTRSVLTPMAPRPGNALPPPQGKRPDFENDATQVAFEWKF